MKSVVLASALMSACCLAATATAPLLEYPAWPGNVNGNCAADAGSFAATASALQSTKPSSTGLQFISMFRAGSWDGDVAAQPAGRNAAFAEVVWSAAQKLGALQSPDASRNIWTLRPAAGKTPFTPVAFTAAELQRAGLWDAMATTEPVLRYLRGDRSLEGGLRPRRSLLGDVSASAPLALKGLLDMQYDLLPSGTPGRNDYRKFVRDKAARTGLVMFPANDGMVHAVRQTDGVEVFAFVPPVVLPFMAQLALPRYTHRYLVDGPLVEADGWWNARWHNVVLGSTGLGPAAVFALDMTDTASPGAQSVMWQFSSLDDLDLGNVLSPPEAGVLAGGQWVAVFGNGVASASGKARLYVVELSSGALLRAIDVPSSGAAPNGLGGVRVLRDEAGRIVAAYAGDLRGNLWRFELSSATPSQWSVGHGGYPLFTARDPAGAPQAITAAPEYLAHPSGGWLVLVGTGRLFDDVDATTRQVQSLYGVRDVTPAGQSSSVAGVVADSGSLVIQKLLSTNAAFQSVQVNAIDWKSFRGWRLDLPAGFRDVYGPSLVKGFARFKVVSPLQVEPSLGCARSASQAYDLQLNPMTGGAAARPIFDTNADGAVNLLDAVAAGLRTVAGSPAPLLSLPSGGSRLLTPGATPVVMDHGHTPTLRVWRQIINFPR